MTDAHDLARRFLGLWEDYLAALLSEPGEMEMLQPWVKAYFELIRDTQSRNEDVRQPRPPAGAASAAGAPGERDDVVAELSRRLAGLEERLAAVERRGRAAARPRSRNRRVGV